MNKFMTVTEARKNMYDVVQEAAHPGGAIALTHEGEPKVVIMSFDEYEGWRETIEIMSDPHLTAELTKDLKTIKSGKLHQGTVSFESVKKKLKV
jgi:antitoxin YefM